MRMATKCFWLFLLLAPACAVQDPSRCPVTSPPDLPATRGIVNGTEDTYEPDKNIVALILRFSKEGKTGGALCTGVVLAPNLVLTAAHCVPGGGEVPSEARASVYVGNEVSMAITDPDRLFAVSHMEPSPSYLADLRSAGWSSSSDAAETTHAFLVASPHDVGVVVLERSLPMSPLVPGYGLIREPGESVRIVGYGRTGSANKGSSGTKRFGFASILHLALQEGVAAVLDVGMANERQASGCNGDSGGPVLLNRGGVEYVIGLFHGGGDACTHGLVTALDANRAFIESVQDRYAESNQSASQELCRVAQ